MLSYINYISYFFIWEATNDLKKSLYENNEFKQMIKKIFLIKVQHIVVGINRWKVKLMEILKGRVYTLHNY
jgi:hypothetical protein